MNTGISFGKGKLGVLCIEMESVDIKRIVAFIIVVLLFLSTVFLQFIIPVRQMITNPNFYLDRFEKFGIYDEVTNFLNLRVDEASKNLSLPKTVFSGIFDRDWVAQQAQNLIPGVILYIEQKTVELPTVDIDQPFNDLFSNIDRYMASTDLPLQVKKILNDKKSAIKADVLGELSNIPFSPSWNGQQEFKQKLVPASVIISQLQNLINGLAIFEIIGIAILWFLYHKRVILLGNLLGIVFLISGVITAAISFVGMSLGNTFLMGTNLQLPSELLTAFPSVPRILNDFAISLSNPLIKTSIGSALIGIILISLSKIYNKKTTVANKLSN